MKIISKSGFTLAEITISIVIISMMMVSLLEVVAYAGEVWQRSHMTNSLTSEGQMVLDAIEREMGFAVEVREPDIGDPATSTLEYDKIVFDYSHANSSSATFKIEKLPLERRVYSKYTESSLFAGGWTYANDSLISPPPAKEFVRSRYNYDLSRHVDTLEMTRTTNHILDCRVVLIATATNGLVKEFIFSRSIVIASPVP